MRGTERYVIVAALVVGAMFLIVSLLEHGVEFAAIVDGMSNAWSFIAALTVYLISQLIRMLRLGVLLGGISVRRLFSLHWYTSAVSLALPFKLGELLRIAEIGLSTRGLPFGLLVVWVERAFDAALLGTLAALLTISGQVNTPGLLPILIFIVLLITFTVILLGIFPENLVRINLYLLRHYRGGRAVSALRALARLRSFAIEAQAIFRGRALTLGLLTVMIWALEIYALSIVFRFGKHLSDVVFALLGKLGTVFAIQAGASGSLDIHAHVIAQILLVEIVAVPCLVHYCYWRMHDIQNKS